MDKKTVKNYNFMYKENHLLSKTLVSLRVF